MPLEGQRLGQYRLLHLLGRGGMGEVYLAEDARTAQQVAIKVIHGESSTHPESENAREAARLFEREAKAIARLDHPNILPLYYYGEETLNEALLTYLVMPYRREGTLASWLRQRKSAEPLTPVEVMPLLMQAAGALQHAHGLQVIHQDIKPTNFLMRFRPEQPDSPDILLADFGIAKLSSATASASQSVRGTPTYMAPEQWDGHPVPATDQYALAIMLYEMLAGRPPFQGGPGQVMRQHYLMLAPPASTFNPRLTPAIDAVLLRALAKQPEQRFPSVLAFAQAFQMAAQSGEELRAVLAISQAEARSGTTRQLTLPGGRQVGVAVPAGVLDGAILRLEGQGNPSAAGGPPGSLVLTISIQALERFLPPQQNNMPASSPGFTPVPPALFGGEMRMPPNLPGGQAFAGTGIPTLPVRENMLAPTLPTTNPPSLPGYTITPFPLRPEPAPVVRSAHPAGAPRWLLLALAALVVVVFASGGAWFVTHRGGPTGGISVSPTPKPHPSPTATVYISPAGIITEFSLTKSSGPADITKGSDGNLWFSESLTSKIGRLSPGGVLTEFAAPTSGSYPYGITAGTDGNLWFSETNASKIGRITTGGLVTEFPTPTPNSGPFVMTKGPDGNLWFTETSGSKIGRISASGMISEFPVPTSKAWPLGITAGPDGNMWFTEYDGGKIGRITTSGIVTEFVLSQSAQKPYRITAGSDGNLWFTEYNGDTIWRITPSGAISSFALPSGNDKTYGIIAGPDKNLWFTEETANRIGRITTSGVITEFPIPTPQSDAFALTIGPDGNLWFTEYDSSKIGRITSGV
ncbi:MAG TPA: protein kinase [Ktedonobacteraceae bacterium]